MARGGSRKGAGRKKVEPEQKPDTAPNKNLATEILESLKIPDAEWKKTHPDHPRVGTAEAKPCECEICLWRFWARRDRGALEYLWNRRDGKPVHIVNHLHDKPIEHTVTVALAETIQKARKRASQR
jgi:hypothetical protein